MDRLNADEESGDEDESGNEDEDGNRVAFSDDDDEEAEAYGGYFKNHHNNDDDDESKPKKKKNRLGQMARRRLAEKAYGPDAKHIKTGGLTVLQREELRKEKSQQRKERAARIKKDVAKASKFLNQQPTESTAPAIRIDPKMHPSWAAKLQQQAKIQQASFQGQKIKFED